MSMRLPKFLFIVPFILLAHGCGGGGGSESIPVAAAPPAPQVAVPPVIAGTLAAGVRVLSNAELSAIAEQDDRNIRFNGTVDLPAGTIILTGDRALKVAASTSGGGQTVAAVSQPRLEEVFRQLDVTIELKGASFEGPGAGTFDGAYLSAPLSFDAGRVTGTMETSMKGSLDYHNGAGGLGVAILAMEALTRLKLTASLEASALPKAAGQEVGTLRFVVPVPLSDNAGNAVGTRQIIVRVPVAVDVVTQSQFGLMLDGAIDSEGFSAMGRSVSGLVDASPQYWGFTVVTLAPVVPPGAAAGSSFTSSVTARTRTRAIASFLGIPLMEFSGTVMDANWSSTLQAVADAPGYCLRATQRVTAMTEGFVVGAGGALLHAPASSAPVSDGPPIVTGACI